MSDERVVRASRAGTAVNPMPDDGREPLIPADDIFGDDFGRASEAAGRGLGGSAVLEESERGGGWRGVDDGLTLETLVARGARDNEHRDSDLEIVRRGGGDGRQSGSGARAAVRGDGHAVRAKRGGARGNRDGR